MALEWLKRPFFTKQKIYIGLMIGSALAVMADFPGESASTVTATSASQPRVEASQSARHDSRLRLECQVTLKTIRPDVPERVSEAAVLYDFDLASGEFRESWIFKAGGEAPEVRSFSGRSTPGMLFLREIDTPEDKFDKRINRMDGSYYLRRKRTDVTVSADGNCAKTTRTLEAKF